MKKALKIGVTGGIGSGKTTICRIFESIGIPVYYADERAKALMIHKVEIIERVLDIFGLDAYLPDGSLNRAHISKIAFAQKHKLAQLNAVVHPAVAADGLTWHQAETHTNPLLPYTLKEAALLIESGSYKAMDKIIVVSAPEALRIARVVERDKTQEAAVRARIQHQLAESEMLKYADFVVYNDGEQQLIPQVLAIHRQLSQQS